MVFSLEFLDLVQKILDDEPGHNHGGYPEMNILGYSDGGVVDLIGDEDPTDEDIGVSVSLGDEIFLEGKKFQESNIDDSDNTRDGGKTAGKITVVILVRDRCPRGKGCDLQVLVEHFNPVDDNTGVLEYLLESGVIAINFSLGISLGSVFLLGLSAFSMVAAYASKAAVIPSVISCRMAASVIVGAADVDSDGGVVDLIGDEDPTDGDIGVSVSLGDEIFSEGKESRESNIDDSDNTGDGGKTAGRAIITWGGGIASLISESEGMIVE
ncbi:hypothetical protein Tco_1124491 [Tanacetum coccineum]|uniref:Uncharacterized protein n=1 Tax=Tanacetum coccineum TaxID=301880 RepID=A0ABQ5J7D9_9ASTR